MDIIYLRDIAIDCVIGVFDWEREIKQTVYVDVDMGFDIRKAAQTDDLNDTLSYKDVAKDISDLVIAGEFFLLETMAERIAALLREQFGVPWCRVRINKRGAVSIAQDVGVVIERGRQV